MKKLFISILMCSALLGCESDLDRSAIDQLTPENAYLSVSDLDFALSSMYDAIPVNSVIAVNSIMTDNTQIGYDNGGQQIGLFNLEISASNGLDQGIYAGHYRLANLATRLIVNAQSLTPNEDELNDYNYALAQAYAMRAYAHYEIMRHYTPDLLDPNGLAISYVDYIVQSSDNPERNTVQEVKDGIISDLEMAEDLIGNNGTVDRVNRDFITFQRARLELITGNYDLAGELADDLISSYPLANRTQYANMFEDTDNTEVIFKKVLLQADTRIGGVWYFTGTTGPFIEMSAEFFNLLNPADIRYDVNVDLENTFPADDEYLIDKYPGKGGFNYLNDFKAMRVSEMYLVKAEVLARNNQNSDAAEVIQQIRNARFGSETALPNYSNTNEALTSILNERRIELAYEGHRYVDLKRFRFDLNIGLTRDPIDCTGAAPCSIPATDYRFTLPIPFSEINANSNINENNPGY